MAYRRRQSNPKSFSTFQEIRSDDIKSPLSPTGPVDVEPETPSLAAQAIRASSAHRDSSISSAYYGDRTVPSPTSASSSHFKESTNRDSRAVEYTSMQSLNESKYGFWGVLARKAKSLIDDDIAPSTFGNDSRKPPQTLESRVEAQQSYQSFDGYRKPESVSSHRSADSISSSLNHIGGTIKNKFEEGLAIVENKTADIIQETKKINIRRKSGGSSQNQADKSSVYNFPQVQADHETQLKASRDVANAMAAKAKLLLRELKTVKADLAFAKERCAQLEEENKMLRESHDKRGPEDDDLIRLQLETLLAEKGRLAHENSLYARENRFLREIVEYHQLTMQDVVYVDEGIEEVTEVFSNSPRQLLSRSSSISNSFNNNIASSASIDGVSTTTAGNNITPSGVVVHEACGVVPTPPTTRTKDNEDENLKL